MVVVDNRRRRRDLALGAYLVFAMHLLGSVVASAPPESHCTRWCGDIHIPYPFGIEAGCYHAARFNLTCKNNSLHGHNKKLLFLGDGTVQVLVISVPLGTVRINSSSVDATWSGAGAGAIGNGTWGSGLPHGGPFFLSESSRNSVLLIGCNIQLYLRGGENNELLGSCSAVCPALPVSAPSPITFPPATGPIGSTTSSPITSPPAPAPITNDQRYIHVLDNDCGGIGCCQEHVILGYSSYNIQVNQLNDNFESVEMSVYIADGNGNFSYTNILVDDNPPPGALQATLDWVINHSTSCPLRGTTPECRSAHSYCTETTALGHPGYLCKCSDGYHGNPYILHGCKDIDECKSPDIYSCYGLCENTVGGFTCQCPAGSIGNASVPNGCKDIDECEDKEASSCYGICINFPGTFQCQCPEGTYGNSSRKGGCITIKNSFIGLSVGKGVGGGTGLLLLALGGPYIMRKIKLLKLKKNKQRLFKQNHGLLLEQLISHNADISGRMIIALSSIEKATNNFDGDHIIGGGGHGVVFKGILDLQVVAIKKSKIVVQREINEFINEVAVLSQVNHRNVVKLLGCCLETEVPLLVYEFISNGTLCHHLHIDGNISLSWDDRMRIAAEVAKALSYLHSAASMPIFHRDIKSANILLDDALTTKVSDFGASRYIPTDQTGVTTVVQGTMGYLDPMYYYTGRLTDKSDVFSFGILLVELLTRKKPYVYRSVDNDGLVSHFVSLHAEGKLVDIIDPQVMEEESGEIQEVATLAAMCTKLKGEDRPTMREVEMSLENMLLKKRQVQYNRTVIRNGGDEATAHYIAIGRDCKEASRQYTMEEEILLSASYPR